MRNTFIWSLVIPLMGGCVIDDSTVEVDRNTDIFDFMPPPDNYFLVGAKINFKQKAWSATAKIDNLLNTNYRNYTDRLRYYADAPGRNLSFSLNYKF